MKKTRKIFPSQMAAQKAVPFNAEQGNGTDEIDYYQAHGMKGDVVIPDTMDEIPEGLFFHNSRITSVTVPGTVKRIGDRAFAGCRNLERVRLCEGIEEIGTNVFTGCDSLRQVTYPDSVTTYQGWTFYGTSLTSPVLNASGTLLVFCPGTVSGKEWTVPDSVKTISWEAFIENQALEVLHLPEGLETIERGAFIACGIREITVPHSVREICDGAFQRCDHLEKVTILNPETRLGAKAFDRCTNIRKFDYGHRTESDRLFHMIGKTFLDQHLEDGADWDHRTDPDFEKLAVRCRAGDAEAMYDFSEWFGTQAAKNGASPFYRRAANYWRYRAYSKGSTKAAVWFDDYFCSHPGKQLESILPETSAYGYIHEIPGNMLNDLGYPFFDPKRKYVIRQGEGDDLVIVSASSRYGHAENPGRDAEYPFDWWFLDGNMQPVPGIRSFSATPRETRFSFFRDTRDKAEKILKERCS